MFGTALARHSASVLPMEMNDASARRSGGPPAPFTHNFWRVRGIGEDFGFNPIFLRVPLAATVLWSPIIAIGAYLALGLVVLASRLLFPKANSAVPEAAIEPAAAANMQVERELPLAA